MAKEEKTSKKTSNYSAESITVLEGLEPVRKRPGMYIGTTGPDGLHHLVIEIFDNSRDEAMGNFANDIEITLLPDNRVRVVDNGRGIPVDIHKQTKVSALETIMTTLHAGGKFGGEGYKVSGGLHGVGASVVNALSIYCKAEVHKDGGIYMQGSYAFETDANCNVIKGKTMVFYVYEYGISGTVVKGGESSLIWSGQGSQGDMKIKVGSNNAITGSFYHPAPDSFVYGVISGTFTPNGKI